MHKADMRGELDTGLYVDGYNDGYNDAAMDIVRCKDCVAYYDGECECDSIYSHLSGDLIGVKFFPNENYFCAYGERK